ncbi:hypothetical protein [Rodentibacter rarus]|uniref:hypothetical protein n=1 Tax=Rodentibacter rarus TaxID=1908260 RepID=UPI001300E6A8|nr:hypothetical protein [Rodentibacter rarus]
MSSRLLNKQRSHISIQDRLRSTCSRLKLSLCHPPPLVEFQAETVGLVVPVGLVELVDLAVPAESVG